MWECFVRQRTLKGFSLSIFCKPQILLAWWDIPLQQSQRAKNNKHQQNQEWLAIIGGERKK
jgi:hypothetical protein